METQVSLELCTAGSAELLTVKGQCSIVPGMIVVHSPVFPMLELSRSADYASVMLHESVGNIYTLFSQSIPTPQQALAITPFMHLTDEQQRFFLQRVDEIHAKEQQLRDLTHPIQRKILETSIHLLRQQTIMEHVFLFSHQLLETPAVPSRRRQVFVTFFLSLNQEYRQHRTVQYYAAQQHMSPRHFADIIKQESDYTPMEWINMVTVSQAKNLLRQPHMLVKQVADELGFPEQFTFRKYFKTHTGLSPTEYQNKNN
ncbi:MAG: helix-turn-helix transcriptional regulator [Bacteroidales bacterium]|jgi:AraC-like DNA-binding protein|nr:helix-turn-helix transcriptional regulator [Bacteroidales bacterium]